MKNTFLFIAALFISFSSIAEGPKYASDETKRVIEKMIEAHGGYEKWDQLNTLSFTSIMHSESLGVLRFWVNDQVVDMENRRTYQDWPLVGSSLAYDGNQVWSANWNVGNPPSHQQSVFFYYLNLPWLTQDDHVVLSEAELVSHKGFDNDVYKVIMSYTESPVLGKSVKDTYTLYIDSKSYLLVGYEYTVGYGPMLDIMGLPEGQEVFGPVFRKNNYIAEINGLKYAVLFTTHDVEMTTKYGDHAIYDIKFNEEFDESRMEPPANAVFDPALDVRK